MTTTTHSHKAWTDKGGHVRVAMHGCVRSGLLDRTSTRSGLTPPLSLNNLLRQNI